jgi:ferrochelatase
MSGPDTAVVLLNLGGPLRLSDVRPFLLNLFTDRDIIRLGPAFLQPLIARIIVGSRLKEVQGRYAEIGGGSPILRESAAQADALRKALREAGRPEKVVLCFRYTRPRASGLLRSLQSQGIRRLLPVTLYPHDCRATTGSSLVELEREARAMGMEVLPGVLHYATDSDYLECMTANLRATLAQAPEATVVFSAHSLPVKQIEAGDPYEREIHATVEALKERLGAIPGGYRLGYQSKVGPIAWLSPALETVLQEMAGREVVIVPVSFVGEHIETLHELDIQYRELAEKLGVKRYLRVPAPGLHPAFIRCLTRRTLEALERASS